MRCPSAVKPFDDLFQHQRRVPLRAARRTVEDREPRGRRDARAGDGCQVALERHAGVRAVENGARDICSRHWSVVVANSNRLFIFSAVRLRMSPTMRRSSVVRVRFLLQQQADARITIVARTVVRFAVIHDKVRMNQRNGLVQRLLQHRAGEPHPQRCCPQQKVAIDDRPPDLVRRILHHALSRRFDPAAEAACTEFQIQLAQGEDFNLVLFRREATYSEPTIYASKAVFCDSGLPFKIVIFILTPDFPELNE